LPLVSRWLTVSIGGAVLLTVSFLVFPVTIIARMIAVLSDAVYQSMPTMPNPMYILGIVWLVGGIFLVLFSRRLAAKVQDDVENDPISRLWYAIPGYQWFLKRRPWVGWGVFLIGLGIIFVVLGLTGRHP
jgi:hypothetical protein